MTKRIILLPNYFFDKEYGSHNILVDVEKNFLNTFLFEIVGSVDIHIQLREARKCNEYENVPEKKAPT